MTFDELAFKLDEQLKSMNLKFFYANSEDNNYRKTSYYSIDIEVIVVIRHFTKVVLFTDSMKTQFFNVIKEDEINDNSLDLIIKAVQKVLSEIKKEKIKEKIKQIKKDF
jgi:hypothetical protein